MFNYGLELGTVLQKTLLKIPRRMLTYSIQLQVLVPVKFNFIKKKGRRAKGKSVNDPDVI